MLQISFIQFLGYSIPEAFLIMMAIHLFSGTKINRKRYIISSLLSATFNYVIRFLPIHLGVNTILCMIMAIILNVSINKINIIKSIKFSIFSIVLTGISEILDTLILLAIFGDKLNELMGDPVSKLAFSVTSLVIFIVLVKLVSDTQIIAS